MGGKSDDIFEEEIRKQVIIATEEADLVLFLVDVTTGLTDWDEDVAASCVVQSCRLSWWSIRLTTTTCSIVLLSSISSDLAIRSA